MKFSSTKWMRLAALVLVLALLTSCGFRRKKYENPITKDTQQPDKVLFDKAIGDMETRPLRSGSPDAADADEHVRHQRISGEGQARVCRQLVPRGWHARSGAGGSRIQGLHPVLSDSGGVGRSPGKGLHDPLPADGKAGSRQRSMRCEPKTSAATCCMQFPNSKFAPSAQQLLRNIQEVIAEGEFRRGTFYHTKGSHPAAANRLQALADHYPLYSKADEANWLLGDSYGKMGTRFRRQGGRRLCANRAGVSSQPACGRGEEAADGDGNGDSGSRSGCLQPDEVRARESGQSRRGGARRSAC